MARPRMNELDKKQNITFSLNPKTIQALNYFSEMVHLPKSIVVSIAINQYLEKKDNFRNNPKVKELLKDMDFYTIDTE